MTTPHRPRTDPRAGADGDARDWLNSMMEKREALGVTRLARISGLDSVGIPVYQAIRPNANAPTIAFGKGLTDPAAAASALMESVEYHCLEKWDGPTVSASIREAGADLPYDPFDLMQHRPHLLGPDSVLRWTPATVIATGRKTLLPVAALDTNGIARGGWSIPGFRFNPTGVGSAATLEAATAHALGEIIEHESTAATLALPAEQRRYIDVASLPAGPCTELIERYRAAGAAVQVTDATTEDGIPVMHASVFSADVPLRCAGRGCHVSPEVALCKALTEAAQVRVAVLSGLRDDTKWRPWALLGADADAPAPAADRCGPLPAGDAGAGAGDAVTRLATVIAAKTGVQPLVVDITDPGVAVPTVVVVAPRTHYVPDR